MPRAPRLVIALVAVVLLASHIAAAQSSSYPYQRRSSLSGVKTFAFRPPQTQDSAALHGKAARYDTPVTDSRTEDAITTELARHGLRRDDQAPDVFVVVRRSYQSEYTVYNPYGWWTPYPWGGWWYGPYMDPSWVSWNGWGPTYVYENVVGTLAIDIEDAESGQVLWRGVGEKDVHEHSRASKQDEHVREEVRKAMKKFPV